MNANISKYNARKAVSPRRLFQQLLAGVMLMLATSICYAAEPVYKVLFIQSYNPFAKVSSDLTNGLKAGFQKSHLKVELTVEYLDATQWVMKQEQLIMRRICQRARERGVDLIVTSGDEAFYTLTHCGDSLGYQYPLLFAGVKYPDWDVLKGMPNVTGYTSEPKFTEILNEANRLFPDRTNVICLGEAGFMAQRGDAELRKVWDQFEETHPNYTLTSINVDEAQPWRIIDAICNSAHTRNTVVIIPKWTPFLSIISKNSKAPVYACQNRALTNGVLAVYDLESYRKMVPVGERVAQILRGHNPSEFPIEDHPNFFRYDYKQLKYFHVDEGLAAEGGEIHNVPVAEKYFTPFVLMAIGLFAVLILIVAWLFRQNRKESQRRMEAQMRLETQQQLVEQRDEYDDILASITDALITYDSGLHIRYINTAFKRLLDLPQEWRQPLFYEGRQAGSIFSLYKDGENILHELLTQAMEERRPIALPDKCFLQPQHHKSYFPVAGEVTPIFAVDRLTGVAVSFRSTHQEQIQESFLNIAVEESGIFPWWYDLEKQLFYFPQSLLKLFGQTAENGALTLEQMRNLICEDDRYRVTNLFKKSLSTREKQLLVVRLIRGMQSEWWEIRLHFLEGATPGVTYRVVGICQSVQRFKDAEAELVKARDKAMQTDQLKSAFLANMSHEIRTPLNSIVGFSNLLKDFENFSREEVVQFIDTINDNCDMLLALINDVLDLARIESGSMEFDFEEYNLTGIIQQVHAAHNYRLSPELKLLMDCPEGDGIVIRTDMNRLKQVFNNLISNARKFTSEGSITIGYRADEAEHKAVIFVKDTGCGMSEEVMSHIFERFYKGDAFRQGAGLGLSICYTIVDQLHGEIKVSSTEGKGSCFEVCLPME
ncbi:MAG: ATP-binding protein [Bacteroides sp.]